MQWQKRIVRCCCIPKASRELSFFRYAPYPGRYAPRHGSMRGLPLLLHLLLLLLYLLSLVNACPRLCRIYCKIRAAVVIAVVCRPTRLQRKLPSRAHLLLLLLLRLFRLFLSSFLVSSGERVAVNSWRRASAYVQTQWRRGRGKEAIGEKKGNQLARRRLTRLSPERDYFYHRIYIFIRYVRFCSLMCAQLVYFYSRTFRDLHGMRENALARGQCVMHFGTNRKRHLGPIRYFHLANTPMCV